MHRLQQTFLGAGFLVGALVAFAGVFCLFPVIGGGTALLIESLATGVKFDFPVPADQVMIGLAAGAAMLIGGIMLLSYCLRHMYTVTKQVAYALGIAACGSLFIVGTFVLYEGAGSFRAAIACMGIGLVALAAVLIATALMRSAP